MKEKISKEIRDLQAELTGLRIKKKNMEIACKKTDKDRIKYVVDIESLKKELSGLSNKRKVLNQDNTNIAEKVKKQDREIAKRETVLVAGQKKLATDRKVLEGEQEDQKEEWGKISDAHVENKKAKADFSTTKSLHEADKVKTKEGVIRLEVDKKEFEKQKKKELDEIEAEKEQANQNLEKSKALKSQYESRLTTMNETSKTLEAEKLVSSETQKQLDKELEEYKTKREAVDKIIAEYDTKLAGLQRSYANLDIKEKEIEIKRLRMTKLINEKNVAKELAKLEKELNA